MVRSESMKLSIVIPCYNEEESIEITNQCIQDLVVDLKSQNLISEYEIIYVDDGSTDKSLPMLIGLSEHNKNLKILSFSHNFGHQAALSAGLHFASGDAAVTLDADMQDPPNVISEMIRKYREGFEIVYGIRNNRDVDTFFKKFTAKVFYRFMRLMGIKSIDNHADFRLLSGNVLQSFRKYHEVNRFLRGLIPIMGYNCCTVTYERAKRTAGSSKYSFHKMFLFAIEGITSLSITPLRMAAMVGMIIFATSLFLTVWALITKIIGKAVPGWTSTVLPIYFLGGIQLLFLGIIGEYIGKIYLETKKRPLYIVRQKFNF